MIIEYICVISSILAALTLYKATNTEERFFRAIRYVETRCVYNPPAGDNGRSIGPYQIQKAYWLDSGVPGKWEDCKNEAYARRVMIAYWQRYCPLAWKERRWEILARVHNGGPRGHLIKATEKYWNLVRARMIRDTILLP